MEINVTALVLLSQTIVQNALISRVNLWFIGINNNCFGERCLIKMKGDMLLPKKKRRLTSSPPSYREKFLFFQNKSALISFFSVPNLFFFFFITVSL